MWYALSTQLWISVYDFLCRHVSISLGYVPSCGIAGSYANSRFKPLMNSHTVCQSSYTIFHSHQLCEGSIFSTSFPTPIISLFDYNHPGGVRWYLIVVLILISLMADDIYLWPPALFLFRIIPTASSLASLPLPTSPWASPFILFSTQQL